MITSHRFLSRLADAARAVLPDDVDVLTTGTMIYFVRGNASTGCYPNDGDRRRTVTDTDVKLTLATARRVLSGKIPNYRPEFVEPARELVAIFDDAIAKL